jgi:magnesium chelatase subunit I
MDSNTKPTARTLGALKELGWAPHSTRDELRNNLRTALKEGRTLFPRIVGYEETVIPQIVNAILSRHDILLLGLRGQAKTRLLRSLTELLDEWMPMVAGSDLNEDPLAPVTEPIRRLIHEQGDETPIDWCHRSERFNEKLATPDVSMADLIGDIDPIRASREKLDLSDPRVIHYGLVPRSNRGLLCVNELPDLQTRIQVGLLNILEERDVQIRGFPVRMSLDVVLLFTANPEDYTNRGSIITPLKDRIGSQIITHYPMELDDAISITDQEADVRRSIQVAVPRMFREIIEEVAVQARESEHVDQTSGVSARLPISAMELLVSNVERRCLTDPAGSITPRLLDIFSLVPAITGKVELVYEGEQEGASLVAEKLIGKAIRAVFRRYFPPVHPDRREDATDVEVLYGKVQSWFASGKRIDITDVGSAEREQRELAAIHGLEELAVKYLKPTNDAERLAAMELVLEGMHQHSMLSREGLYGSVTYGDMISRMMQDLS